MSRNFLFFRFAFLFFLLIAGTVAFGQQKPTAKQKQKKAVSAKPQAKPVVNAEKAVLSKEDLEENKQKISRLISFLEFALNIIGSDSSAAEDKEVIINSSYLKFFNDSKVQIEDDLDEGRKVVTFKSVQAYLHDVDYFFSNAVFELNIDEINSYLNDKNNTYFIVGITRYLKGITSEGDTVRNTKKRFVEINLGAKDKDLKIASIYSTRYNEAEDLELWWKDLPEEWKQIFRKEMGNSGDSINYGQLKRILSTENLNLSGNNSIVGIEPLNKLARLKTLNISNTKISDLAPLRNLILLEVLDCSNTAVTGLEKLKYTNELKELYIHHTGIASLDPVMGFSKLEKIDFHQTPVNSLTPLSNLQKLYSIQSSTIPVTDLSPLAGLKNLNTLNISETEVNQLQPLSSLDQLSSLDISSTKVSDLTPLASLKNLKELLINGTQVNSLQALKDIPTLEKIYCDHSSVSKEDAKMFMVSKPGTLVIFESEGMLQWWNNLSPLWKNIFQKYIPVKDTPTMEQLAAIANLPQIDISGNKEIISLEPISTINNLKILLFNNTGVVSLDPLKDIVNIEILEMSNTRVNDVHVLNSFAKLQRVNLDNTAVDKSQVEALRSNLPNCIVIYKTQTLNSWWAGVPDEWRAVFKKHLTMDALPNSIQLHQLVSLDSVGVANNNQIKNLEPLKEFERLKILELYNTSVNSLDVLAGIGALKKLGCSKNPVKSLQPISKLTNLIYLDFENTGVEELEPLKELKNIETLKFSGTPVEDLKHLALLDKLTFLDCSSTSVNNLKPLDGVHSLKLLKCYNTRLSAKKIEKFRKDHPDCEIVFY